MSAEEDDYMIKIVRGEQSLFEGGSSNIDVMTYMYFQLAVLNDQIRPRLREEIGETFDGLVQQRLGEVIPLIERFRTSPRLAAIENDLMLIVRGCELFGLEFGDFISPSELLPLARVAQLRSAKAFKEWLGTAQPACLMFAHAAAMGITAEEMGLKPDFVEECITTQLYRGHSNPELASLWTMLQEQKSYLEHAVQTH